jgi:hypothetical protein
MSFKIKTLFCLLAVGFMGIMNVNAQVDHSYKPLTLKLNEDGSKYVRFIMWHQIWATYTDNNNGTRDIEGNLQENTFDVAMRRSRFLAYAQVSPRCLILTHWGINNQSFTNGGASAVGFAAGASPGASNGGKRPALYMHDAWTEFEIFKDKLSIGAGLHYWNGISRMTNASTLNFMTLDAPIFNWATIEGTDQFARQYGIYAKGQISKLDYRLAINKPFSFGSNLSTVTSANAVNILNERWATQGYVNWMFWDKESNKLPFMVGSYLGTKKVFNIGAGFHNHPDMTGQRVIAGTDTSFARNNVMLFGADAYLDMPLNKEKGTAINAYVAYYNYDFGPNYIRNIGILNLHTASVPTASSWAGGGNAQPTIGTGSILYGHVGYLLPALKNGHKVMPYAAYTYKNFDRIGEASSQFDLGLNYFVIGHNAKVTLQYSTRPTYVTDANNAVVRDGSKGEFILQTHIFL